MSQAKTDTTAAPTRHASIHFSGYRPGKPSPFVFDIMAIDNGGNCIPHGPASMSSEQAVETALYILTAAAGLERLTNKQREKLRSLAAVEPAAAWISAPPAVPPRMATAV